MLDQSAVGATFPPFEYRIDPDEIRAFAAAIGDRHPAYAAGAALPPTMATAWVHRGNPRFHQQLIDLGVNLAMVLHGEEEFSYLAPIRAGDTVSGATKVLSVSEKSGRSGAMDLLELETTYAVGGVPSLVARSVIVVRRTGGA